MPEYRSASMLVLIDRTRSTAIRWRAANRNWIVGVMAERDPMDDNPTGPAVIGGRPDPARVIWIAAAWGACFMILSPHHGELDHLSFDRLGQRCDLALGGFQFEVAFPLRHRAMLEARSSNNHLNRALSSRIVIEQANGIVAEREHLDMRACEATPGTTTFASVTSRSTSSRVGSGLTSDALSAAVAAIGTGWFARSGG